MNAFHRTLGLLGVLQVLALPAPATAASVYPAAGELMLPAPISVADVVAVSATCALSNGTAVPQSAGRCARALRQVWEACRPGNDDDGASSCSSAIWEAV